MSAWAISYLGLLALCLFGLLYSIWTVYSSWKWAKLYSQDMYYNLYSYE